MTGCTGFMGKIVLEKIMRTMNFRRIYIMIRPKQGITLAKRVHKEIFSSVLFEPLFQKRPDMHEIIKERIVPVSGDLVLDKLGIDPKVREQLTEDVDIIMSLAASINFQEPIHDALQINYFGATRILQLAHECKKLEVLVHVSTAYVNTHLPD